MRTGNARVLSPLPIPRRLRRFTPFGAGSHGKAPPDIPLENYLFFVRKVKALATAG
jgi:hypothetical protein